MFSAVLLILATLSPARAEIPTLLGPGIIFVDYLQHRHRYRMGLRAWCLEKNVNGDCRRIGIETQDFSKPGLREIKRESRTQAHWSSTLADAAEVSVAPEPDLEFESVREFWKNPWSEFPESVFGVDLQELALFIRERSLFYRFEPGTREFADFAFAFGKIFGEPGHYAKKDLVPVGKIAGSYTKFFLDELRERHFRRLGGRLNRVVPFDHFIPAGERESLGKRIGAGVLNPMGDHLYANCVEAAVHGCAAVQFLIHRAAPLAAVGFEFRGIDQNFVPPNYWRELPLARVGTELVGKRLTSAQLLKRIIQKDEADRSSVPEQLISALKLRENYAIDETARAISHREFDALVKWLAE